MILMVSFKRASDGRRFYVNAKEVLALLPGMKPNEFCVQIPHQTAIACKGNIDRAAERINATVALDMKELARAAGL